MDKLPGGVRVCDLKQFGLLLLATVLLAGNGCDQNPPSTAVPGTNAPVTVAFTQSAAEKEWLAQGEAGDAEAQFRLGLLYLNGVDSSTDPAQATERFRAAANAYLTTNSTGNATFARANPDAAKAVMWLTRAAEQGHKYAQPLLADQFRAGRGTPKNVTQAIKWYKLSAQEGNPWSAYELAMIYANGEGDHRKDVVEAVKWYHQAAEAGIVWAQYELASLFDKSKDIPHDFTQAAHWYEKAAQQDHDWAEYGLAYLYYTGRGVEKNLQTAYQWFQKAAERGNPEAQYMLGYMLSEGLGCERNQFEAGKWLFLAVKTQGKPHHHEHWLLVRGRLSEKELTEIRLHAAQFKPRKKTG